MLKRDMFTKLDMSTLELRNLSPITKVKIWFPYLSTFSKQAKNARILAIVLIARFPIASGPQICLKGADVVLNKKETKS